MTLHFLYKKGRLSARCFAYGMALFLSLLFACRSEAQKPVLRVDLNESGRPAGEVNERNYDPWTIRARKADSLTLKGITIRCAAMGLSAAALFTDWYKAGIQNPYYARLVNDGVTASGKGPGAVLELRISGLPTGKHTLITYHNEVQSPEAHTFSPIDIYVDGKREVHDLVPSIRALRNEDAARAYLTLNASAGKDVVILFKADPAKPASYPGVVLNGFELNVPDPRLQAKDPLPGSGNGHVETPDGRMTLRWTPAPGAEAHDLYWGTDSGVVASADRHAAAFVGRIRDSFYMPGRVSSDTTYYWRVDEIKGGRVTPGDVWKFTPAHLAFRGAEGYGRFARGGRGGKVVVVTNLHDAGPGSLREAVSRPIGPRTIVFAVGGMITLKSTLNVTEPFITVAGQTAPGKGICIRHATFGVTGNDVVIRFMRVSLGKDNASYGGMGLTGCDNSILDHCSISWTMDEAFSSRGAKNITLQHTLIAEALNVAGHHNYPPGTAHGYAASIGGDIGSFHHNLLADCYGRNWSLAGGVNGDGKYAGRMDIRDNVVYNWGTRATDGGAKEVNFVNNYYKPGAGTTFFYAFNAQHEGYGKDMQRCYFAGNVMPGHFNEPNETKGREESGHHVPYATFVDTPFFPSFVNTESAEAAYKRVVSDVGCDEPRLDDHDTRIINETIRGTYSVTGSVSGKAGFPDSEQDAGGYENYPEVHRPDGWDSDGDGLPDWWEILHGLNPHSAPGDFSDADADKDQDGYTNLEDYLCWMALPHYSAGAGGSVRVDLASLTRGYTDDPVFKITGDTQGKAVITGHEVTFYPTGTGLSSFTFQVKDQQGDTLTRQINVVTGMDVRFQ